MKKSILTFLLCLSSIVVFSQNKYYTYINAKKLDTLFDASKLKSNPTVQCVDPFILENILGGKDIIKGVSISGDNPFFDDYNGYKSFLESYRICEAKDSIRVIAIKEEILQTRQSVDSRSSSSWQTAVLQGTADFMAQRFKDELTNFALNSLIANIKKKDSLKFKILFPKTLSYINTYLDPDKNNGFYNSDLDMLRYTAELDLNNIINQLPEFIDSQSGPKYKSNFFRLNSKIITDPKTYSNPEEIFDELARLNNYYNKIKDTEVVDSLKNYSKISKDLQNEKQLYLLDIIVNGLKNGGNDATDIWVDSSDIDYEYYTENITKRFFYAILYEQTKNILFNGEILSKEKLIEITKNLTNSLKDIEVAYVEFKNTKDEIDTSDYKKLIIPVFETIDSFTTDETPKLKNISSSIFEIEQVISNKDYKFVLPYLFNLLDELKIGKELVDKELLNTISLIVNFTLVENAEDMKNLLNTYALPIGSSSLKRTGKSDISFNGYVGLTLGYEVADSGLNNSFFNLGLTAPIGMSLSHRYSSKSFISSGSIFLGFIDLGSLVNNSFDDNIEIQSDLSFQQFFVPSLGYFLNIKNSPFSFGMVGSYHFDSRVLVNSPEADGIDVFRLNLSLLVDIPFFTLSHKN